MADRADPGHGRVADPFGDAWRTRDLDRWIAALAPDVVLHSPLLSTPFRGARVARDLYDVLFAAFGPLTICDRARSGNLDIVVWRSELAGRTVEGTDILRYRPEGDIAEIRVLMRPLTSMAVFASTIGPPFARRRSRLAGTITRPLTRPLGALCAIVDRVSPLLLPLGEPHAARWRSERGRRR